MNENDIYKLISNEVKSFEKEINNKNKLINSSGCYCECTLIPNVIIIFRIKGIRYDINYEDIINKIKQRDVSEIGSIIRELLYEKVKLFGNKEIIGIIKELV